MSSWFNIICLLSLIVYMVLGIVKIIKDKREAKAMNTLIEAHKQKVNSLCNIYKRKIG